MGARTSVARGATDRRTRGSRHRLRRAREGVRDERCYIKNAVLRAAFAAAAEGAAIGMAHLERAACSEYDAMGKLA